MAKEVAKKAAGGAAAGSVFGPIGALSGAILGGIGGIFSSGQEEANKDRERLARESLGFLGSGAINKQFQGFQNTFNPIIAQMAEGAAVGANLDTQTLQAGLARQGLGNTGLGAALGAGLRSGATFQTNQLRARLLSDLFGQAVGTQAQKAGLLSGTQIQAAPGMGSRIFQGSLQGAGIGAEAASLLR